VKRNYLFLLMVFTLLVGTLGVTGSAHAQEPKWEVKTVEILGVKAHFQVPYGEKVDEESLRNAEVLIAQELERLNQLTPEMTEAYEPIDNTSNGSQYGSKKYYGFSNDTHDYIKSVIKNGV
jgi:hypothetical protein